MRQIMMGLIGLGIALTIANVIMANFWLQVALVSIVATIAILGLFSLGVWVGSKRTQEMIMLGADIVLRGQEINDKWDTVKTSSLANFGKAIIQVKQESLQAGQQYPILPPSIEGSFTIAGLDEEIER